MKYSDAVPTFDPATVRTTIRANATAENTTGITALNLSIAIVDVVPNQC